MKQDDFERLKAICEREGLYFDFDPISVTAVVAKKTDPWEGVEFVECVNSLHPEAWTVGKIYKVTKEERGIIFLFNDYGSKRGVVDYCSIKHPNNNCFKPSTEAAYVEQLKREAFERFGEINVGDRFTMINSDSVIKTFVNLKRLYIKHHDSFSIGGVTIYEKGKWAERVKERVDVEFISVVAREKSISLTALLSKKAAYRLNELESFLSQQLEKYLNGEVE